MDSLKFVSTNEALSYLARLTGQRVAVAERRLKPGDTVKIKGMGLDDGKIGEVVANHTVKTNDRGVPVEVEGAYKPVDWSKELAVRLLDGRLITVPKGWAKYVQAVRLASKDEDESLSDVEIDDLFQEWRDLMSMRPGKWNYERLHEAVRTFGYTSVEDLIKDNPEVISEIVDYIQEKIYKDSHWTSLLKRRLSNDR